MMKGPFEKQFKQDDDYSDNNNGEECVGVL